MSENMQEVKPLREVPGVPMHCGRPMRKLSSPSVATGKLLIVYTCAAECGAQIRDNG